MNLLETIAWLTGYRGSNNPDGSSMEFSWEYSVQSWGVFVYLLILGLLGYFIFSLYRMEQQSAPRRVKWVLGGIRMLVILLLAIIFLGPAVSNHQERTIKPYVAIGRDISQSMRNDDSYANDEDADHVVSVTGTNREDVRTNTPTRAEIVDQLLARHDGELINYLDEKADVVVFDFALESTPAQWIQEEGEDEDSAQRHLAPIEAIGRGSDYHQMLRTALSHDPLAAIVIFGDGQHNRTGLDPRDLLEGDSVPPIFLVGVGDPSPRRDIRVSGVNADRVAYPGNPFPVSYSLHANGLAENEQVTLQLLEFTVNEDNEIEGTGQVVDEQQVVLPFEESPSFTHVKNEPGNYAYMVRAEVLPNESNEENNICSTPARIEVREDQAKVLLIAGSPTWEYRRVAHLLTLDSSVHLSCWLQTLDPSMPQDGNESLRKFPDSRDEIFEYSVIMLFDPNPNEFDNAWIELLREFVYKRAGGLLYMAGPKYSSQFLTPPGESAVDLGTAAIAELLPVRLGNSAESDLSTLSGGDRQNWDMVLVEENLDQPIMSFFPDRDQTLEVWERLSDPLWSFNCEEGKPGTRTLLEHSSPSDRIRRERDRLTQDQSGKPPSDPLTPLLVTGRFGAGRTVYSGFNGTWRWRSPLSLPNGTGGTHFIDGSRLHRRFWLQTVNYLVEGRSQEGRRRGWVRTDKDIYEIGDPISVTAQLFDASQEPLQVSGSQLDAWLISSFEDGEEPTETPIEFRPIPNLPGAYQLTLGARETGFHRVEIRLPNDGGDDEQESEALLVYTEYDVTVPTLETEQPELNKGTLRDLANLSGGGYIEISEFDQLKDLIEIDSKSIIVPGTPRPLWDTANVLLFIVLLLSGEWLIRKSYKLL